VSASAGGTFGGNIDVTGTILADGLTVDGNATLQNILNIGGADPQIRTDTSDGSDNKTLWMGGGGVAYSWDRGGYFYAQGNEAGGHVGIAAGNISGASIKFTTGASEAMRISAGNVGIGAAAANSRLYVSGSGFAGQLLIAPTTSAYVGIGHGTDDPAIHWQTGDFRFATSTARDLTGFSEKMRITNAGNLLLGTTNVSPHASGTLGIAIRPDAGVLIGVNNTHAIIAARWHGNGEVIRLMRDGTDVGSIDVTTSSTSYNTSSDYRLKTDAQPMTGASARVQALNPVNFEWIASGERVDGFLAHEAATVVPESVTGTKDAMRDEEYEVTAAVLDDDGNETTAAVMGTRSVPDMQGIDQAKIVPLLTAALREALTKIDTMETRLAALEAV
jgi:hypothetical protein